MITIDTKFTLYVCTDGTNGEVHIMAPERLRADLPLKYARVGRYGREVHLRPRVFKHIEHLCLDDPDPHGPYSNDVAVYKLLCESNMDRNTFLI